MKKPRSSKVWLWFWAACLLQVVAWIALLVITSHHPVEEVPLATAPARR
ncbi:MAG: hypothetical protein ACHQ4G_10380 [Opitutales bacterium]